MAPPKGFRHSEESKAKMSESRKGRPQSPETKAKIGAANRGRTLVQKFPRTCPCGLDFLATQKHAIHCSAECKVRFRPKVADLDPVEAERQRANQREWQRAYRQGSAGKERTRKSNLAKYGMTLDDYDKMLADQGGVCASCGLPETGRNQHGIVSLAVDHCHTTGRIRGLLCMACNRTLGMLGENVDRVIALAVYAERWKI